MHVETTKLSNGLTVATAPMPDAESAAVGIWVGVGGRHEASRMSGVSHFIEHLLFKGTRKRSSRAISQAIEGRGGYLNAFTQEESTCYYARVGYDHAERAFDVLADMYRDPVLAEADIRKEREVIIEEIAMYEDQPQHVVQEMLGMALWKGHPLGRPLIGSARTLRAMERQDIAGFKETGYVPANTVLVMSGRVEHGQALQLAEKQFGELARGRRASCRKASDRVPQNRMVVGERDIEQSHMAMAFRCFGRRDERRFILRLLNVILGENMSSRLFQVVREKHGLAYSIHSSLQLFQDVGALFISAGLERNSSVKALQLVVRELKRIREKRVGAAELKRARDYAIGQMRLGLEGSNARMLWAGESLLTHGKYVAPEHAYEKLRQVTADDIAVMANEVLRSDRASISLLVPGMGEPDRASVRQRLADLG